MRLTCFKPPENKVLGVGLDETSSCFKTGLVRCLGLSWLRGFRISGVLGFWKRKHEINNSLYPSVILFKGGDFSEQSLHLWPDSTHMQTSGCWVREHASVWINAYTHTRRAPGQASASTGIFMNGGGWVTYGLVSLKEKSSPHVDLNSDPCI